MHVASDDLGEPAQLVGHRGPDRRRRADGMWLGSTVGMVAADAIAFVVVTIVLFVEAI